MGALASDSAYDKETERRGMVDGILNKYPAPEGAGYFCYSDGDFAYLPKTFFTSPTLRSTLPSSFSAVPRFLKSGLPMSLPVSSFTLPATSFAVPLILSSELEFITNNRIRDVSRLFVTSLIDLRVVSQRAVPIHRENEHSHD